VSRQNAISRAVERDQSQGAKGRLSLAAHFNLHPGPIATPPSGRPPGSWACRHRFYRILMATISPDHMRDATAAIGQQNRCDWVVKSMVDSGTASDQNEKSNENMVGVVGFEPTTPASRTYRPDHHLPHFQPLSTTRHHPRLPENRVSSTPACRLRAKVDQGCRRPRHPAEHGPAVRLGEIGS